MASTPRHSYFDDGKDPGPDDSVSMVSTSTAGDSESHALQTPTSSSAPTSTLNRSSNIPYITRDSAPGPGSTYIIVTKCGEGNQALTVVEGHLRLATPLELLPNPPVLDAAQAKTLAGICNWHWQCEESDGWLCFRNAATGLWLESFCTCVNEVKTPATVLSRATSFKRADLGESEQFCVRKSVDDKGYLLLKRVDLKKTVCLLPVKAVSVRPIMSLAAMNLKTADVDKQRMTWEFVKVDHDYAPETRIFGQPL
ncbi:hypothetical protein GE21DRAFT_8880 [Neurospora crassa]|uniref:Uncharacterized protein n=1 Tax=Neurospora crassa (strain ATCC 24698 / 74-OR23-1A / CBS 708.71 / DSM 1257 / FGSC 987) TaxID=367110 RepID=Q7S5X5_NEUCR|nr:hypothetical protein NCU05631 [Neurospora crassa OR74A]EAA30939.3 hypothetical protein NCU05631 [Neurospora crassa OR74A]KHE80566.1 hypothetical protein GE21DRAFT_8880 [Neurospora crassa]|eukprot:XP_960175.3 hypothetical protein NCU05631 [Neurospora crassa OR74A]